MVFLAVMMKFCSAFSLSLLIAFSTSAGAELERPVSAPEAAGASVALPAARWDHRPKAEDWTSASLQALQTHGQPLVSLVPRDIETWCPAYPTAEAQDRRAFWVGFLSALSKYESTYRAEAVSSNGKWFGLLQISPATARGYGCVAGSGEALKTGSANLSCAIRIMATTVIRDGVVHGRDSKWRGVSADWGPMRSASKRASIAAWVRDQDYCAL